MADDAPTHAAARIQPGDRVPSVKVMRASAEGPREVDAAELFAGKTVVLFGVPGAFTPTCSARHLPGYVEHAAALREKGADLVACLAVNDAFVMAAWAKANDVSEDAVAMLADGSGALTRAMGLEFDLSARGLGVRSQRFVLVARDGVVRHLAVEEPGAFEVSRAEDALAALAA